MEFSTKLFIGVIVGVVTAICGFSFYKVKYRKKIKLCYRIFGDILTILILPLAVTIAGNIIYERIQDIGKSDIWTDNITAQDEVVMIESGYKDLDDYYVRIVETESEMETGLLSGHFQRIYADDGMQMETHRYIEMISKEKTHAPVVVNLTDASENCVLALSGSGNYFEYTDFYAMKDNKSARYYYYRCDKNAGIQQNEAIEKFIETAKAEDRLDSLEFSQLCEQVYMPRIDAEQKGEKLNLKIYIASEVQLSEGMLDSKWSREFIGMRNYESQVYKGMPKHLYCYLQEGEIISNEDVKIPLLKKESIDGDILGKTTSEISLFNYVPKSKKYVYQTFIYALGSDIMQPMYVFKCEE